MGLRVEVQIQPIRLIWLKEKPLKVLLKLSLSKRFEHGNISLLSIKLILVSAKFFSPETFKLFILVLVLLRHGGDHGTDIRIELFIAELRNFCTHLSEMYI